MIRYFLITFTVLSVFLMGVFGFRGRKFRSTPFRLFPDLEVNDKLKSQKPSKFFADGYGSRPVVPGSIVHSSDDSIYPIEFGEGRSGYYYEGKFADYFGNGMPKELDLTADNAEAFLNRGKERYNIYCAVCHGEAGDGAGITSKYGIAGIANFHAPTYSREAYPDGRLYDVVTNGKGNMSGYGYNIPVRDRWAIVAYVRALQNAKNIPLNEVNLKK